MDILISIIFGVMSSLIASVVFWVVSFKITLTKIQFASVIEKSKNTGEYPGENRYRIKLINTGKRDLIEINLLAKISVKRGKISNYTYLGIGNDNKLPLLRGKKYQCKTIGINCAHTLTLYPTEVTLNEFKKSLYSQYIQLQAQAKSLCLEDVLREYGNDVKIIIYAYGNDSLTGARRMFTSPIYRISDAKYGRYAKPKKLKKFRYKEYIHDTLGFVDIPIASVEKIHGTDPLGSVECANEHEHIRREIEKL